MLKEMNGNRTEGVKVYCCEVDPQLVKISSDIIALAGLSDVVQVIEGMSGDTIRKLKDDGTIDKIDVLFLVCLILVNNCGDH
jgi:predicted O-methyltransferase YrrM